MADPRIQTVADVLREHGHNSTSTGLTTDDLATAIVNALDGTSAGADDDTGELSEAEVVETAGTPAPNPETPTGTGTEGGAGTPAS